LPITFRSAPLCILFPYTTLFRSFLSVHHQGQQYAKTLPLYQSTSLLFPLLSHCKSFLYYNLLERVGHIFHCRYPLPGKESCYHLDRKSTRLNSSHVSTSYAACCL